MLTMAIHPATDVQSGIAMLHQAPGAEPQRAKSRS